MTSPSRSGTTIKVPVAAHALLRRIALDLSPGAGRQVTLSELVATLAQYGDQHRDELLALLAEGES